MQTTLLVAAPVPAFDLGAASSARRRSAFLFMRISVVAQLLETRGRKAQRTRFELLPVWIDVEDDARGGETFLIAAGDFSKPPPGPTRTLEDRYNHDEGHQGFQRVRITGRFLPSPCRPVEICQPFAFKTKVIEPHSTRLPRQTVRRNLARFIAQSDILIIESKETKKPLERAAFSVPEHLNPR